ncbi:DUF1761 domain-containing protein [Natronospirillum operosum]|nr:DUF1761 domain-containing protein [Natronospirillum operosum]
MSGDTLDFGFRTWLAIGAGGLASFMLGALWYMLLFSKPWVAATGRNPEEFGEGPGPIMLLTLAGAIISTAVLAVVYQWSGGGSVLHGMGIGALLGVGVAAVETLKKAVYNYDERTRPWPLFAVDAGYAVAGLVLAGAVYALIA